MCTALFSFFFNDTATTEIYTLSLHDALPISALPARRHEALPQGRALLYRQVRLRAALVSAGAARPEPSPQALGLRRAAAREAEGQADLRHRREAVPRLLLQGAAHQGRLGPHADPAARAAARQRGLPDGLRVGSRRGAPA